MVHQRRKKHFKPNTLVPKDLAEKPDKPLNFIKINPWHLLITGEDLQIR